MSIGNNSMKANRRKAAALANLKGYAFIAPNYILMLVFSIFPIFFSLSLSFTSWDLVSGFDNIKFVGFENFTQMAKDPLFSKSLINNVYFTAVTVPLTMVIGLLFAIVLNDKVFGRSLFRLVFYIPNISNIVAVSLIWAILYSKHGPLVSALNAMGIKDVPNFLASEKWAMPAVMFMSIWIAVGYCILVYIGGLQGIPEELYEAATIDGANGWRKFLNVTLPMLSPTTFFILITQIIGSFKVFGQIQLMTDGGPIGATTVLVYYIYTLAFRFYKFGYASAIALVLFVIIMVITLIQWRGQKKWVNY